MSEAGQIPDRPTGPEEDAGPHSFEPQDEPRDGDVFVTAACACGWTGSSFATSEDGYADAQQEWEHHASASRHETKRGRSQL